MAWTEIMRPKYRRDGLRYASDTTDAEWRGIEPHLPPAARCGRTRKTSLRDVVDGIFYIAQTGCQRRLLPKDFPPHTTVQRYFYAWRDSGVWQTINHVLLMEVREAAGREASPTAGVTVLLLRMVNGRQHRRALTAIEAPQSPCHAPRKGDMLASAAMTASRRRPWPP